jgi:hypothetical protein
MRTKLITLSPVLFLALVSSKKRETIFSNIAEILNSIRQSLSNKILDSLFLLLFIYLTKLNILEIKFWKQFVSEKICRVSGTSGWTSGTASWNRFGSGYMITELVQVHVLEELVESDEGTENCTYAEY